MRILFIIHQFFPEFSTGTERFTLNVAKMHQRNGHRVDVLCCALGDGALWQGEVNNMRRAVVDGIPVYGLPRPYLGDHAELGIGEYGAAKPLLESFLDQREYDVVHVTHSMRMLPAIELVRDRSIPYVLTLTDFYTICHRINLVRPDGALCGGPQRGEACQKYCCDNIVRNDTLEERWQRFR
jgi:glycosyltransferase involved in cell wall biosynthesis